jgi:hypothetical protein
MEKRLSLFLAVAGSALLISGCYTQVGTVRDEPSREYSASEQEVDNESPPADSGYSENGGYGDNNGDYDRYRERFYYDYYYPPFGAPWAFGAGVLMGGYYSPFFWNPWDPWYPGGGWYYPHSAFPYYGGRYRQPFAYYNNGAGGRYGQTRNFGVTRGRSGSVRGMSGGAPYGTSPTARGVTLPASGSSRGTSRSPATTATTRSTTGHNSGRSGAVDRAGHGRTGGSRATGRYSTPPPPPRSSGGGSRGTSGGTRYSPPSHPPASTGSTGRSSGGGGSSSGGSGGSRGGSRR